MGSVGRWLWRRPGGSGQRGVDRCGVGRWRNGRRGVARWGHGQACHGGSGTAAAGIGGAGTATAGTGVPEPRLRGPGVRGDRGWGTWVPGRVSRVDRGFLDGFLGPGDREGFRVDRGCRDGFREDGRRRDERHLSNVRGRRSRVGGGQVGCRKCADAMSVGVGDGGHGADIGLGRVVAHDRPMQVARAAEVPGPEQR